MKVKRLKDIDELERAAQDICDHYCRYPLLWDEQMMGMELRESEFCNSCPLVQVLRGTELENNMGNNPWQE